MSFATFILTQYIHIPSFIFTALAIGSIIADIILIFSNKRSVFEKKLNLFSFYGYAVSLGGLLGSTSYYLSRRDQIYFYQISLEALLMTSLIFFSFSAFALLTSTRVSIYLGVSFCLFILSILNLFIWNGKLEVIIGMIMAVGYIIVDTQHIIHKANNGMYENTLTDAKMLFVDFAGLFIKILVNLMKEKEKEKNEKEN